MKFKNFAAKMTVTALVLIALLICCVTFFGRIVDAIFFVLGLFAPFIFAFIISLAVNPLAEILRKKLRLPQTLTAIIVVILTVGIVGGALVGIVWKIVSELKSIYIQLPQIYDEATISIQRIVDNLSDFYNALPDDIQNVFDTLGKNIQSGISGFINDNYRPVMSGAGSVAKALPSIFIGIIVFILSLYFMISNGKQVRNIVGKIIPQKMLDGMSTVWGEIKKYLGGYVKAQLIIMSISFVIILIGLSILKVQYSMLIALGVALLDALPFFGSGAVLIPWSVISFISSDIKMGIGMIIIYLSVIFTRQMVEPKIVSSNIGINPLFTLMSMYIGYRIFSLGGMILGPVIIMLTVSFYKAGAFNGIIILSKKIFVFIKSEIKDLFDFITMK